MDFYPWMGAETGRALCPQRRWNWPGSACSRTGPRTRPGKPGPGLLGRKWGVDRGPSSDWNLRKPSVDLLSALEWVLLVSSAPHMVLRLMQEHCSEGQALSKGPCPPLQGCLCLAPSTVAGLWVLNELTHSLLGFICCFWTCHATPSLLRKGG